MIYYLLKKIKMLQKFLINISSEICKKCVYMYIKSDQDMQSKIQN